MLPVAEALCSFNKHCDELCTSGVVDDVMFSHNKANEQNHFFVEFVKWRHQGRSLLSCLLLVTNTLRVVLLTSATASYVILLTE